MEGANETTLFRSVRLLFPQFVRGSMLRHPLTCNLVSSPFTTVDQTTKKTMDQKRIFFSVGEPSGDLHASNLILDFRNQAPVNTDFEFFGFGGPKMADVGCHLLEDMTQHAVMFLSGVLAKIAKFRRLLRQAEEVFSSQQVDLVILIDYSGFNWHVARRAKKHGIPVVFYGIPQMWAWAPWRVKKMRKYVDLGICKLPFEKDWLEQRNCRAEYVGHPFFDEMERQKYDTDFEQRIREELKLDQNELVTLLPGSRTQELKSNLPLFVKTARLIQQKRPSTRFAISCLDENQRKLAGEILAEIPEASEFLEGVPLLGGRTAELIRLAKCCLACSGSVSLELMYRETPTVIHYRLPRHLFMAQRLFLGIKYITLVNLLSTDSIRRQGRQVYDPDDAGAEKVPFPEYLTCGDKSREMSRQLLNLLNDETLFRQRVQMLQELKREVGHPGASSRAANLLLDRFFRDKGSSSSDQAA